MSKITSSENADSNAYRSQTWVEELIDVDWYRSIYPTCTSKAKVLSHYRANANSDEAAVSPSPYFSTNFYTLTSPTELPWIVAPFEHFLTSGCEEGRDPHPLFMSNWYRDKYQLDAGTVPFLHYLTTGWKEGFRPNPAFWSDWYKAKYEGVWGDPLHHYLTEGWKLGNQPNPLFDPEWYRSTAQTELGDGDPFTDYLIRAGTDPVSPHPLFDADFYREQCGELGQAVSQYECPLLHFFLHEGKIDPHVLFDSHYYRSKVDFPSEIFPIVHYMSARPKFDPHPFFSSLQYLASRPDVASTGENPLVHYLTSGFRESCSPHELFDNAFYLTQYPEVEISPLVHYLKFGVHEGRRCRPLRPVIREAKRYPGVVPFVIDPATDVDQARVVSTTLRKGAFAHVFYPDLIDEVISATNNIPGPCRVFISTDSASKADFISRRTAELSIHEVEIRIIENRGRDIAPMLVGFCDRLLEVEIGVHLHTKKSKHYASQFDRWRRYLFDGNLGSRALVVRILSLFDNSDVGMVAPVEYGAIDPLIQWGGNISNVRSLVAMMSSHQLEISEENLLELPSGSMFWFRTEALMPLLKLSLRNYHFDPELGQVDGTLAHAVERSFFYSCEIAGYAWVRHRFGGRSASASFDLAQEHLQKVLPVNSGKSPLVVSHPEIRSFTASASAVERPRLNLLIPSAETSNGYAGISEALRLFAELKLSLGETFDYRIIATDIAISNHIDLSGDETLAPLFFDADTACDVVVDGTLRSHQRLAVRRNDVFVATAWWTAILIRDVREWQKSTFGCRPEKFVYLIQDYESGFYPWSTKYMLAESTYQGTRDILPLFNTDILASYFYRENYFKEGFSYKPPINERISNAINRTLPREKILLLYVRPHALRNCLEFANALIESAVADDPEFWGGWSFLAIGEDFEAQRHLVGECIDVKGRLSLEQYADYLSRARVGVSLMVSPHPSYPPLEMAEAGLLVLTNTYANKDLSELHDNLRSFSKFDLQEVTDKLRSIAEESLAGVTGQPKADWFFDGKTNLHVVVQEVAAEIFRYVPNV